MSIYLQPRERRSGRRVVILSGIGMRIGTLEASSGEVWLHTATGLSEPIQNDSRFRQAVAGGYAPYKITQELDLRSQLCVQARLDRGIPSPAERGVF